MPSHLEACGLSASRSASSLTKLSNPRAGHGQYKLRRHPTTSPSPWIRSKPRPSRANRRLRPARGDPWHRALLCAIGGRSGCSYLAGLGAQTVMLRLSRLHRAEYLSWPFSSKPAHQVGANSSPTTGVGGAAFAGPSRVSNASTVRRRVWLSRLSAGSSPLRTASM
jgi:hypothetical protein